tara:strand:+ start:1101 stop:1550 length:450 start_codon:yes stop_codon:yes gene_type:complete
MIRRPSYDSLTTIESPPKLSPQMFSRSSPEEINFDILNCIPIGILVLENSCILGCNSTFTKHTKFCNIQINKYSINNLLSCVVTTDNISKKNLSDLKDITESITRMQDSTIKNVNIYNKNDVFISDMIIKHDGRFCIITFPQFSDLFTN